MKNMLIYSLNTDSIQLYILLTHNAVYGQEGGTSEGLCCPNSAEPLVCLLLMRQLMVDQLIVGTTGRAALGISFMKPEPHDSSVVFLACRELCHNNHD